MRSRSEASAAEGIALIMCCWCTVLAAGLVAPILPAMRNDFATIPHIDLLVGGVAAAPALMVALLALPIGAAADSLSLRGMLLAGLAIYGTAGVMPAVLGSLGGIIVSRIVAGIGEGATMIASTALIARRFEGERQRRWLALQVLAANVLGIAVVLLSGRLGLVSWRLPFVGYAFGLLMMVPVALLVRTDKASPAIPTRTETASAAWAWRAMAGLCLLYLLVTIAMFSIILQLPFLLAERGAADSFAIGLGLAAGALGLAAGAAASARLAARGWRARALVGLVVIAAGFGAIGVSRDLAVTELAAAIAGMGAGFALPALLAAFVASVPRDSVGRALGVWTVAGFAGQFATPPTVLALADLNGRGTAYALLGVACLIGALAIALTPKGMQR